MTYRFYITSSISPRLLFNCLDPVYISHCIKILFRAKTAAKVLDICVIVPIYHFLYIFLKKKTPQELVSMFFLSCSGIYIILIILSYVAWRETQNLFQNLHENETNTFFITYICAKKNGSSQMTMVEYMY